MQGTGGPEETENDGSLLHGVPVDQASSGVSMCWGFLLCFECEIGVVDIEFVSSSGST